MRWTVTLSFLLAGCSATGQPPPVTRSDSAGVEIVRSSGPLAVLDLAADTALVFGGEEAGPAAFFQVRPALVDVDQEGLIYVLDRIQHQVSVFAPAGELVATWGRQGEGPGELSAPLSVTASHGTATVHDAGRALFVSYAVDGGFVERAAPRSVIHMWFEHVQAPPDRLAFWDRDVFTVTENRRDRLLSVRGADTVSLVEGKPAYSSTAYHPRCSATFTIAMPLSPQIRWSQWENRVVVVAGPDFQVDWFDGPRLARRSTFGEPAPKLSAREVVGLLEARGVRGPCNSSPREYIDKHGYSPKPQAVRAIVLHPHGPLWVRHEDDSGNDRIVVFDSTAAPLGVLPDDIPMPIAFLPDGRALIQVVDSVDVERIGIVDLIPGEGRLRK